MPESMIATIFPAPPNPTAWAALARTSGTLSANEARTPRLHGSLRPSRQAGRAVSRHRDQAPARERGPSRSDGSPDAVCRRARRGPAPRRQRCLLAGVRRDLIAQESLGGERGAKPNDHSDRPLLPGLLEQIRRHCHSIRSDTRARSPWSPRAGIMTKDCEVLVRSLAMQDSFVGQMCRADNARDRSMAQPATAVN